MEIQSGSGQSGESVSLEIRLFGDFQVEISGAPIPSLRTRKGQWLLALLTLRHDRETPRDWLAGTLWPDSDESLALANLRRSLNDLRHALGSEAPRLLAPTPRSLRFDLAGAFCDVHAFDAAIQIGMRAEGGGMKEKPSASSRIPPPSALEEAVALYRGPLLEACPEPWAVPERERREQSYLSALQTLAHQAMQQGQQEDAIPFLRRILQVNPLLEAAQIALMEAFTAVGEPAEAIRVYREFRLLLRRELNAEPEGRTTALYRRLRSEAGQEGLRYSGIPLGNNDQRPTPDDAIENQKSKVENPGAPLLSLLSPPSNALVGRGRELATIVERLASARLVTLTGMGGIGKTRLAQATAEEVGEDYPGEVWFVPLADLAEPERLLETVRDALCLPPLSSVEPLHQIRARLAGEKTLLVLDNMEQLLPVGAEAVQRLLAALPQLTILITSRHRLGLSAEWEISVPPLSLPDPASPPDTPEAGLQYPGVELFVTRARMRNPDFALTAENLAPVVALCTALEGIPLATELAAAWTQVLSPVQMQARLSQRFQLLKTRQQDSPSRHRSLYAAMESSFRLLSPASQSFFTKLSIFRGGWTLEAAEAVCAEPNALEALADLSEASLVVAEERAGEMRFRFLDTVREFAAEQQSDVAQREAAERHIAYFLSLAQEATQHLDSVEQTRWLDRLDCENENLRAALDRCVGAEAKTALQGLELAVLLHDFWDRKGYLTEGRQRLMTALESAGAHAEVSLRASALRAIGGLSHRLGDLIQGEAALQEALGLSREHGDTYGETAALANLGELKGNQGDFETADALLKEALQQYREQGNRKREGEILGFLGYLAREQKDFATARALTEEALAIHRALGNRHGISWNLGSLGYVAEGENNREEAERLFTQALFLNREMQNTSGEAWALTSLAHLARGRGDTASASALLQQAVDIYRSQHEISSTGWALFELGATLLQQGDSEAARATLQESLYLLTLCGENKVSLRVTELLDSIAREAR